MIGSNPSTTDPPFSNTSDPDKPQGVVWVVVDRIGATCFSSSHSILLNRAGSRDGFSSSSGSSITEDVNPSSSSFSYVYIYLFIYRVPHIVVFLTTLSIVPGISKIKTETDIINNTYSP